MSELEMEIARSFGASSFLIFQFIKYNPGATSKDIQIETGLSEHCVWMNVSKLKSANILKWEILKNGYRQSFKYTPNKDYDTWKIH